MTLGVKIGKKWKKVSKSLTELGKYCIQKTREKLERAPRVERRAMSLRTVSECHWEGQAALGRLEVPLYKF